MRAPINLTPMFPGPPGYAAFNNDNTRSFTCSAVNGLRM
jgi:hypothetical protein